MYDKGNKTQKTCDNDDVWCLGHMVPPQKIYIMNKNNNNLKQPK